MTPEDHAEYIFSEHNFRTKEHSVNIDKLIDANRYLRGLDKDIRREVFELLRVTSLSCDYCAACGRLRKLEHFTNILDYSDSMPSLAKTRDVKDITACRSCIVNKLKRIEMDT